MNLASISLPLALAAGAASFLSPCVLPLVPAYIAFFGGSASSQSSNKQYRATLLGAGAFGVGLALYVIAAYYVLATVIDPWKAWLLPLLGVVVVVLGLQLMGVIHIPWLNQQRNFTKSGGRRGVIATFLLGLGFAAGWTPCIGPILGAVLTSGVAQGATGPGMILIVAYCVGLTLPFVAVALCVEKSRQLLTWFRRHHVFVERTTGAIVVVMGVLVVTGHVTLLNSWFSAHLPAALQDPFNL